MTIECTSPASFRFMVASCSSRYEVSALKEVKSIHGTAENIVIVEKRQRLPLFTDFNLWYRKEICEQQQLEQHNVCSGT